MLQPQQQQQSHDQKRQQFIDPHVTLSRFDTAVADLKINYSPSSPIPFDDHGFEVNSQISLPSLSRLVHTD